jgi:hypothetical protein
MHFDLAPNDAGMVLELAAGGIEGVANGDADILVGTPRLRIAANDDLAAGHRDIEPDPEQIALLVAPMLTLDGDSAGHDLVEEPVELLGVFPYSLLDLGRGLDVAEGDLQWQAHRISSTGKRNLAAGAPVGIDLTQKAREAASTKGSWQRASRCQAAAGSNVMATPFMQ